MSRRQAREIAIQTLFHMDFNADEEQSILAVVVQEQTEKINQKTQDYAFQLIHGTRTYQQEIDQTISELSNEWKLERMPAVDRNIARVAIFELLFSQEEISPKVIINEAIEVAKSFGSDQSGSFINGILGSLLKRRFRK